ncbi:hypothetical protein U6N30_17410 [Blastococcus brunescens]|uniref:Uncharacterized protein n=1 Tax=Blastococcus brunescens TaxID=1564165 RepID=A0ABZ1ATI0_9ACTN|nr:hypothetical protein [Blastococcus sp. BMG 8361]WRL61886.1 hypothetical protein U6N30_17410 [Blastococcus sp. BMG 8361]
MALLSVGQLVTRERWSELSLLLLLTALPTVVVAVRRPDDRPVALPVALLCLAGAALLAMPDGLLGPVAVGVLLTVLYCVAMTTGAVLEAPSRRATARAAAVCSVAAAVLLRAEDERTTLAVLLAVQSAFTLSWAWRTHVPGQPLDATSSPPGEVERSRSWRLPGSSRRPPTSRRSSGTPSRRRSGCWSPPGRGWWTARRGRPGGQASWWLPCPRPCSP